MDTSNAINEYFRYVQNVLKRSDKFSMFLHLFRYPLDTVTVTEEIYKALEKVYQGQNPVYDYGFVSDELLEDWTEYREETEQDDFWRYEAWDAMKTQINSVMIVDVQTMQEGNRPNPYTYFLNLSEIIFCDTKEGEIQSIAFWNNREDKEIAFFDSEKYWLFRVNDSNDIQEVLSESEHELTYCPARFFWSTPKSNYQKEIKKSPISNYLGKLDWLLFYSISKKQLDTYGSYPIVSVFRTDCDYVNEKTNEECRGGFLQNSDGNYILLSDRTHGTAQVKECPVCAKTSLTGAGSKIIIDPPSPENDNADLRNPVSFHQIDRSILDYNVEELKRIEGEIISGTTGGSIESINNKAVNEKQVMSLFEGRKAILQDIQENLERARSWSDKTQCLLRYGSELFLNCYINMGTEYFLFSETQLLELYEFAKNKGFSHIILDYLQDQYFKTKYRNNKEELNRVNILLNLEPYRHLTTKEAQSLGVFDDKELILKANFSSLIQRFERENTLITDFGNGINFNEKINRIKNTLLSYIQLPTQQISMNNDENRNNGEGNEANSQSDETNEARV